MDNQLNKIFKKGQSISILNCGVYRQDIQALKDYQWLRSESITLLCSIFQQENPQLFPISQQPQLLCLHPLKIIYPSIVSMLIQMGSQDYILESMQSQNLFCYRYLVMPCNTQTSTGNGSHWFLMIYDTIRNYMWTMDSAYQCLHKNAVLMGQRLDTMRSMFKVTEARLQMLADMKIEEEEKQKIKTQILKKRQFKATWLKNIVKQTNNYDCGVYACGNIQRFLNELTNRLTDSKLKKPKSESEESVDLLDNLEIDPGLISVDAEFFRDLRLRYFQRAFKLVLQSAHQQ